MGFAQNLDHLMQSRGMTKYQLAKKLVCHQTSVTNWLENGTVPQKRTLGAIANLFNISIETLCSDDLPDFKQKENPTVNSGGAKEALLNSVENTDDLETLLAILDAVNKKLQERR